MYGRPRSPTYSLPYWAISRAIRPAWHKEWLSEYSIERRARASSRPIGSPARGDVRDAAVVLVGATGIVGEPFPLYRAAGRRRRRDARLLDRLDGLAAEHARTGAAGPGTSARRPGSAVRPRGMADHGDRAHRRSVLLARRAAWRAPRSEHPVLEVAAGFGSYDRAVEGEHSARGSATARIRDHRYCAADHAAVEQRS